MIEWPIDKLTLINSALTQTGDNLVAIGNTDSDEWRVTSPAYERAMAFALEDHGWSQATKVNPNLPASPTPPADTLFNTAYPIPADCLHLIWVRQDNRPALYDLLNGEIVTKNVGSPGIISIKYISTEHSDSDEASPTLLLALQTYVMAAIYRGLHENLSEANARELAADKILARARYTHDTQRPRRALFNSRLRMSRKIRRPWNTMFQQWGGTGTPSS